MTSDDHQQAITEAEAGLQKAREGAKKLHDHATNAVYYAERALVAARAAAAEAARRAEQQAAEVDDDHDPVNHPQHYQSHPSGVECIEITEHMNFCVGNAVKYLWRAGLKGDSVENLEKARWYITREINRITNKDGGNHAH